MRTISLTGDEGGLGSLSAGRLVPPSPSVKSAEGGGASIQSEKFSQDFLCAPCAAQRGRVTRRLDFADTPRVRTRRNIEPGRKFESDGCLTQKNREQATQVLSINAF
jgi:hypothetical protein